MPRSRWLWMALIAILIWTIGAPSLADSAGLSLLGQNYRLESGQRASGSVSVLGGNAVIAEGAILNGDLAVIGGSAHVQGTVMGQVVVMGGAVTLDATAVVQGDVVAMGALDRHPDAQVGGNVVVGGAASQRWSSLPGLFRGDVGALRPPPVDQRTSTFVHGLLGVLRWLGTLAALLFAGAIATLLLPDSMNHIANLMKRSAPLCIGMGVFTLVALAILIPVLSIIIVGIPVAIVLAVALVLAGLIGWISAARVVGQRILSATPRGDLVEMVLGIVVLSLLGRVPCIGWLATLIALSWGLGAVVLTRFGTSSSQVWSPFASLERTEPAASRPEVSSRPPVDTTQPAADPGVPSQPASRGDTRPLDGSDLDEELSPYMDEE